MANGVVKRMKVFIAAFPTLNKLNKSEINEHKKSLNLTSDNNELVNLNFKFGAIPQSKENTPKA